MFPLGTQPMAWPMAYSMMAVGVPRSVAWPTAEANAAALDAAETATRSINNAFSSYRSTGGHALAQIAYAREMLNAFVPLAFGAALWPMIMAPRPGF
jgi:hypothetical protein